MQLQPGRADTQSRKLDPPGSCLEIPRVFLRFGSLFLAGH
jgi:hypothetical protein